MKNHEYGIERHFFLEKNQKRIYCVKYLPREQKNKQHGVILCKPIWGERIRTHRVFTNLARLLATEGFSVITCDYFGDGNSGGESLDLNVESMTDDILCLQKYLNDSIRIHAFSLVGLLIGANIAILAGKDIAELKTMLLFEPLLNPVDRMKKALRANLSSQMVLHKKIIKNREALIEDLENDIPVNVDGFLMGKKLWKSFEGISPFKIESEFDCPVSVYSMVKKGLKGTDYTDFTSQFPKGESGTIEQEFIWTDWKNHIPAPPIFFQTIKNKLIDNQR